MGMIDRPPCAIYRFPMAPRTTSATEESGSTPISPDIAAATEKKEPARGFLQSARRDLNDEEVAVPAVARFLIADIERLEQDNAEQKKIASLYHDQRVEIARLSEQNKKSKWIDILSYVCLAVGSAGLGASPSYLSIVNAWSLGVVFCVLSAILVITGVLAKVLS
ncbi:hypothetical protein [Roseicella sp. DB1501]|uniref:hypothetical protein n=1 Tax=Roseicella sp. DB1501 TaxID=2730925 RepID=UPI0014921EB7|nr:hypothetical protein [Roseicella sp. DB1501]